MDESVNANVTDVTSATSNMVVASSILGVIKRFIGAFVISDAEKLEAGIVSDNYHERQDARRIGEQPDSSEAFRAKG